jgi:hypothetical protein
MYTIEIQKGSQAKIDKFPSKNLIDDQVYRKL